jgi:hypothetical protein
MEHTDARQNYRKLLNIRHTAYQRNLAIAGWVFLVAALATLTVGLVFGLAGRQIYLVLAANLVFGMWFGEAWVRLLIVRSNLELLENI